MWVLGDLESRNLPKVFSDNFLKSDKLIAFTVFVQFKNGEEAILNHLHPTRIGLKERAFETSMNVFYLTSEVLSRC